MLYLAARPEQLIDPAGLAAPLTGDDAAVAAPGLGSRVPLVHIKDGPAVKDQPMTAVGEGIIDWAPVIRACADTAGEFGKGGLEQLRHPAEWKN